MSQYYLCPRTSSRTVTRRGTQSRREGKFVTLYKFRLQFPLRPTILWIEEDGDLGWMDGNLEKESQIEIPAYSTPGTWMITVTLIGHSGQVLHKVTTFKFFNLKLHAILQLNQCAGIHARFLPQYTLYTISPQKYFQLCLTSLTAPSVVA